jgi:hypothetical protein
LGRITPRLDGTRDAGSAVGTPGFPALPPSAFRRNTNVDAGALVGPLVRELAMRSALLLCENPVIVEADLNPVRRPAARFRDPDGNDLHTPEGLDEINKKMHI